MPPAATLRLQSVLDALAAGEEPRLDDLTRDERAGALLLVALDAASRGRDEEAAREARAAANADPRAPHVAITAARLLFVVGHPHEALGLLDRAAARTRAARCFDEKFQLCRRLGWYRDAQAALAAAVKLEPRHAERHLRAAELFDDAGDHERAERHVKAALALAPGEARMHLLHARILRRKGDFEGAQAALAPCIARAGDDIDARLAVAAELLRQGLATPAERLAREILAHAPRSAGAHQVLAEVAAWRADIAALEGHAREVLDIAPGAAAANRHLGIAALLRGDFPSALALAEEALRRDAAFAEAHLLRAEALFRLGRYEEVPAALEEATRLEIDWFTAHLLRLLAGVRGGEVAILSRHVLDPVREGVRSLLPGAEPTLASGDALAVAAVLERALAALGGNRTRAPTAAPLDEDGEPRPLRLRKTSRFAAKSAQDLVAVARLEDALRRFEEAVRAYPHSPHPYCYRGELFLWLGHYPEARADFERALSIHAHTRWARIGLCALLVMEGRLAEGLAAFDAAVREDRSGPGPTVHVYRGEALRKLGRLDEAIAELTIACRRAPSRASAWVNLALAQAASGDEAGHARSFGEVERWAPGLLADAALEVPGACRARLLEHMLSMMRGNRSSSLVLYTTGDGRLRQALPAPGDRERAREIERLRMSLVASLGLPVPARGP